MGGAIIPKLPSRRDHSRRRRGLVATPKAAKGAARATRLRVVHPEDGGGSLPAPFSAETRSMGERMRWPKATGPRAFEHDGVCGKWQKERQKGGFVLVLQNADPESCATGDKSDARLAMPAALILARPNGYSVAPFDSGVLARRGCGAGRDIQLWRSSTTVLSINDLGRSDSGPARSAGRFPDGGATPTNGRGVAANVLGAPPSGDRSGLSARLGRRRRSRG